MRVFQCACCLLLACTWMPCFAQVVSTSEDGHDARNHPDGRMSQRHTRVSHHLAPQPVFDFFVRTYKGDGHWLAFMLRSMEKWVPRSVYRNIIVAFPRQDTTYFESYLPLFDLSIRLKPEDDVFIKPGPNNGSYFSQMYSKLMAHKVRMRFKTGVITLRRPDRRNTCAC